jgi:hypothetical protein
MAKITATKAGNWNDAATWDLNRIPVVGDTIDLAGYLVTFDIDLPDVADVLDTATVNEEIGTFHAPTVNEVKTGAYFGPASALEGVYPVDAGVSVPLQWHIDEILSQTVFGGELYYIQHPDPAGTATQVAQTYGVFTIVGGESNQNLEGDIEANKPRVQISVYAIDSADLVAKVAAINAAMLAAATLAQTYDPATYPAALFNYSSSVPVDGYESETKRFYSHLDFYCWLNG